MCHSYLPFIRRITDPDTSSDSLLMVSGYPLKANTNHIEVWCLHNYLVALKQLFPFLGTEVAVWHSCFIPPLCPGRMITRNFIAWKGPRKKKKKKKSKQIIKASCLPASSITQEQLMCQKLPGSRIMKKSFPLSSKFKAFKCFTVSYVGKLVTTTKIVHASMF